MNILRNIAVVFLFIVALQLAGVAFWWLLTGRYRYNGDWHRCLDCGCWIADDEPSVCRDCDRKMTAALREAFHE